jgi:hypothetical protein
MTTKTAMIMFVFGLILTGFGVGGVENSISNRELIVSLLVSLTGLAVMWVGTLAVRAGDYYD